MSEDKAVTTAAQRIQNTLALLRSDQRTEAVASAWELGDWCSHCGGNQPLHGTCQCWNDE